MRRNKFSVAVMVVATMGFFAACGGSGTPNSPQPRVGADAPDMTMEVYDTMGNGIRLAHDGNGSDNCDKRSPNLGKPNGTPNEDHVCVAEPRDFAEAVTNPTCPCDAECLKPYFDHNKNRSPDGTMQLYTPPSSRRYYPGVPSAKHWENGVEQNIFTYDVELTNFYDRDMENVYIVISEITPDEGREGFQDARPHICLNNEYAIWSFGDIAAGDTVTRTVKLWLPNDKPFKIVGFIVSLDGAACDASLTDTDGDNIDDATELVMGTDPYDPDTDGDGLFDGSEDNTGTYVNWWQTGTDPLLRDTDGDCFGDGTEIAENYSPLDASSHPNRKCNHGDLVNPVP